MQGTPQRSQRRLQVLPERRGHEALHRKRAVAGGEINRRRAIDTRSSGVIRFQFERRGSMYRSFCLIMGFIMLFGVFFITTGFATQQEAAQFLQMLSRMQQPQPQQPPPPEEQPPPQEQPAPITGSTGQFHPWCTTCDWCAKQYACESFCNMDKGSYDIWKQKNGYIMWVQGGHVFNFCSGRCLTEFKRANEPHHHRGH